MRNVYKGDRNKSILLFVLGGIALSVMLGFIVFMIWALKLRTEYRTFCFETVNQKVLEASAMSSRKLIMDGESCEISNKDLEYYNKILLDAKTLVASRKDILPDENSLTLEFAGARLIITDQGGNKDDGWGLALRWEYKDEVKTYTIINGGNFSFLNLQSYARSCFKRAAEENP